MTDLFKPEVLSLLQPLFQEVVDNEAYKQLKRHFDELNLRPGVAFPDNDALGQRYLQESGVKQVFRTFELCAQGDAHTLAPDDSLSLEPESLEDDSSKFLD